jgi:tetratricopeptide (TPR) repeat protein
MKLHSTESLLESALQARREHKLKYARSLFRKALDESRSSEDRELRARLYAELAYVERTLGDLEDSKTHYLKAAGIHRELGHVLRSVHAARHAADILREQGKREEAGLLYTEILETYRASSDASRLDVANAIRGFALLKTEMGADGEASALWEEARDLYRSEDIEAGVDECARQLASLLS